MGINNSIKKITEPLAKNVLVTDVRIGLGYTAVLLDNGQVGVAYTFHEDIESGCSALNDLFPLAGRPASDFLSLFDANDNIESSLALATSNALSNTLEKEGLAGDVLKHLELQQNDTVGMIGNFIPLVPRLYEKIAHLKIFEQIKAPKENILPIQDAGRYLPDCQVVFITSTSIINHTIDKLLNFCGSCREVVMLGASTPLIPEAFVATPVTMLSGIVVTEPEAILRIVSEGGGMRLFKKHIYKANMRLSCNN